MGCEPASVVLGFWILTFCAFFIPPGSFKNLKKGAEQGGKGGRGGKKNPNETSVFLIFPFYLQRRSLLRKIAFPWVLFIIRICKNVLFPPASQKSQSFPQRQRGNVGDVLVAWGCPTRHHTRGGLKHHLFPHVSVGGKVKVSQGRAGSARRLCAQCAVSPHSSPASPSASGCVTRISLCLRGRMPSSPGVPLVSSCKDSDHTGLRATLL